MDRKYTGKWTGVEGEGKILRLKEENSKADRFFQIVGNIILALGFVCFVLLLVKHFLVGD